MLQGELDEISDAFLEAWNELGDILYYVTFEVSAPVNNIYREQKHKNYDFANKKSFHGTIKESPSLDESMQSGMRIKKAYEVTLVTKELIEQGITHVNSRDIICYTDRFNVEYKYRIVDEYHKVQLANNRIFTIVRVVPYE